MPAESSAARADQADATGDPALGAQVAVGEFTSALTAARKIADPARRDQWLARIAGAQMRAGEPAASYNTLASVADDRVRAAALKESPPVGAQGGFQANFTDLINLITTTVSPTTWDEVGGPGSIQEYRNGVYVDAQGVVRRSLRDATGSGLAVARLEAIEARSAARQEKSGSSKTDPRAPAQLRKVSLTRLEKQVQLRMAAGRRPSDDMLAMAGLEKIKYVFVYPETGDIVLAGPAGTGKPMKKGVSSAWPRAGRSCNWTTWSSSCGTCCTPKVGSSAARSIRAKMPWPKLRRSSMNRPRRRSRRGRDRKWLKQLRDQMGQQDIVVNGIDPHTRVAQVLVEADYRMKLVGMGLEPGVQGVRSYLELVQVPRGEAPPPLDVLRWWFTLNDQDIRTSDAHDAFELAGHGVRVQSENEMLSALGRRVHTGKSEPLNHEFAQSFTEHFAALAAKYPVYADLENIFDLALVGALVKSHDLANQAGWHLTCFGDPAGYPVALRPAPKTVETVINHRVVNQTHILAGVSGGVHVDPWPSVSANAVRVDKVELPREHHYGTPPATDLGTWWWD